jgi:hypothetical protein
MDSLGGGTPEGFGQDSGFHRRQSGSQRATTNLSLSLEQFRSSDHLARRRSLDVPDGDQQQLRYTRGSACRGSLKIDLRFSHALGAYPLLMVEGEPEAVNAQVVVGDYADDSGGFEPNQLAFEMKLYRDGRPVSLMARHKDKPPVSAVTFSEPAEFSWNDDSVLMDAAIERDSARSLSPLENVKPVFNLCGTASGSGNSSWDRVEVVVSDNTGSGTIKKGTRIRLLFSGAPGERSSTPIPATSDSHHEDILI